jgi:hypothetical protein
MSTIFTDVPAGVCCTNVYDPPSETVNPLLAPDNIHVFPVLVLVLYIVSP